VGGGLRRKYSSRRVRCGQEIKKRLRRKVSQPPSDVDAGNAACAAQFTAARDEVDWSTCWLAGGASQFLNRGGWVVWHCCSATA
jgi:hypothetical protein